MTVVVNSRGDTLDELVVVMKSLNRAVIGMNAVLDAAAPGLEREEMLVLTRVRNELSLLMLELLGVGD